MKNIALFIAYLFLANSCVIEIHGITNDYPSLSNNQKKTICPLVSFDSIEQDKIYIINAIQLKEEIKKYSKALVYIFKNSCSSDNCKPMMAYENYTEANGYKLFLVMCGYGSLYVTVNQKPKTGLYSMDNAYYKTKYQAVYARRFENELRNKPWKEKEKEHLGRLFFFENGKFVKQEISLPQ